MQVGVLKSYSGLHLAIFLILCIKGYLILLVVIMGYFALPFYKLKVFVSLTELMCNTNALLNFIGKKQMF
jgi:hypothetical protein